MLVVWQLIKCSNSNLTLNTNPNPQYLTYCGIHIPACTPILGTGQNAGGAELHD